LALPIRWLTSMSPEELGAAGNNIRGSASWFISGYGDCGAMAC